MNIWQHCLLSQHQFGGLPQDYEAVHQFMDASKLFSYHLKHRLLLHHLFGVELAVQALGNFLPLTGGKTALVRDVAVAHCREDLLGKCPSLYEWLAEASELQDYDWQIPQLADAALNRFIWQPFLRTGHRGAFIITATDFGVFLTERFFGWEAARQLAEALPSHQKVALLLPKFTICARWQHKPDPQALQWLAEYEKKF